MQAARPEEIPPARVPPFCLGPRDTAEDSLGIEKPLPPTCPVLVPVLPLRFSVSTRVSLRKTGQCCSPTPEFVLLFLLSPPYTAFAPQLVRTRPERVGTTITTRIPQGQAELRFLSFPELMKKV